MSVLKLIKINALSQKLTCSIYVYFCRDKVHHEYTLKVRQYSRHFEGLLESEDTYYGPWQEATNFVRDTFKWLMIRVVTCQRAIQDACADEHNRGSDHSYFCSCINDLFENVPTIQEILAEDHENLNHFPEMVKCLIANLLELLDRRDPSPPPIGPRTSKKIRDFLNTLNKELTYWGDCFSTGLLKLDVYVIFNAFRTGELNESLLFNLFKMPKKVEDYDTPGRMVTATANYFLRSFNSKFLGSFYKVSSLLFSVLKILVKFVDF